MDISADNKPSESEGESGLTSTQSRASSQLEEMKLEEGTGEELTKKRRQRKQLGLGMFI